MKHKSIYKSVRKPLLPSNSVCTKIEKPLRGKGSYTRKNNKTVYEEH
jgi:stalled ribosome alternative rescue factor ArfA